jgi:hypothetical protein
VGGEKVLKHEEDISSFILYFFNLFKKPRNKYPYMTEVIFCNIYIIIYYINVLF